MTNLKEMKVEELRIGNVVYVDYPRYNPGLYGLPMVVKEICRDRWWVHGYMLVVFDATNKKSHNVPDCFIKPIPLTEDILLKCGFKRVPKNLYVDNIKDLRTAVTYLKGSIIWNESTRIVWVGNIALDNIKYLHELQNLYFAITGEELEVKL